MADVDSLSLQDRVLGPLRLLVGFVGWVLVTLAWVATLVVFLPSRTARIKTCNYFGKLAGGGSIWLSGCPLEITGQEQFDANRPAIYISNHTSIIDLFIGMWISPVGTVGVAKKQVVFYPLLGQIYLLSGHLRIDRGNTGAAKQSLRELAEVVKQRALSIWIWPEGTRSRDGRLLPFKKGAVHLALQTGLPIVPVVVTGAHLAWTKGGLAVRRVPIGIHALPAIDTKDWVPEKVDEYNALLERAFSDALPPEQRPLAIAA